MIISRVPRTETDKRIADAYAVGWSKSAILRNLKQQGHALDMGDIDRVISGCPPPAKITRNMLAYKYQLRADAHTCRMTKKLAKKYETIVKMLNEGAERHEIQKKLKITKADLQQIISKKLTKIEF